MSNLKGQRAPGAIGGDMTLRLELFVRDVDATVRFYCDILGFRVDRASPGYVSIVNGQTVLGIGPASQLGGSHHFRQEDLARPRKGVGTELVLEVDDVHRYYAHIRAAGHPIETPMRAREWGASDFRIVDPDGYYLRMTSRVPRPAP